MIPVAIQELINAAQDARHCLCAVNDESLRGSIERTITTIEATIANVQKHYLVGEISLPGMDWVKSLPRPTSSSCKEQFIEQRESELASRPDGWPY